MNFDWMDYLYNIDVNSKSPKDLLPLYRHINVLIHHQDYKTIDAVLVRIVPTQAPTLVLIGTLRLTYLHRHKLTEWKLLLIAAEHVLNKRGLDATKLLTGLL